MLYGLNGLKAFNKSVCSDANPACPFYETVVTSGARTAKVHHAVVRWMDRMAQDARCHRGRTALGDLLHLVRDRLLVVVLAPMMASWESLAPDPRAPQPLIIPIFPLTPTSPEEVEFPASLPIGTLLSPTPATPGIVVSEAGPAVLPVLPPTPGSSHASTVKLRALAAELVEKMAAIYREDDDSDSYWLPSLPGLPFWGEFEMVDGGREREGDSVTAQNTRSWPGSRQQQQQQPSPPPQQQQLQVTSSATTDGLAVARTERVDYGKANLDNNWDRHVDNEFAAEAVAPPSTTASPPSKLCTAADQRLVPARGHRRAAVAHSQRAAQPRRLWRAGRGG